jgi:hypothetical protein
MSSSIELLSLNELNIRRENLIQLIKKVDTEIEKRKEKISAESSSVMKISEPVKTSNSTEIQHTILNSTEIVEKKKIKIKICIKK